MTARIADFMTPHPVTLNQWELVARAREIFLEQGFSFLPLVDDEGRLVGVISASDLAVEADEEDLLDEKPIADVMSDRVVTAASTATVADAALALAGSRIHHLVVVDAAERPVGVLSTLDVAKALVDSELEVPVSELMTTEMVTVDAGTTAGDALDVLEDSTVSAALVQDGMGAYVGVLSRVALLRCEPDERVDQVMVGELDYVEADVSISEVAAAFVENGVRRMLVVDDNAEVIGIVTPTDLIQYAAGLAEMTGPDGEEGAPMAETTVGSSLEELEIVGFNQAISEDADEEEDEDEEDY